MKRIFYLIVIISLPILLWFQYDRYRRFNPPTDYRLELNPGIDVNYYDPEVVLQYYKYAHESETYARYCWKKHKVDVLAPQLNNPEEQEMARIYNQIKSTASFIEQKLLASANMKSQGYSNEDIRSWETTGLSPENFMIVQILGEPEGVIRMGEEGDGVWKLQRLFHEKGYDIRVDGVFDQETLIALNQFQETRNMKVTQGVDREVLEVLLRP